MRASQSLSYLLGLAPSVLAQFGFTEESDSFVVNSGGNSSLVTTIRKSDCDVRSLAYRGTELQGPQDQGTHIGSGLGSADVTAEAVGGRHPLHIFPVRNTNLTFSQTNMSRSHVTLVI